MSNKTTTEDDRQRVSLTEIEQALEAGVRNTERAAAADADLRRCAADLDKGIARWSDNQVRIELAMARRPKPTPKTLLTFMTGGLMDEYEESLAIRAYREGRPRQVLCWVKPAARGYPIDISYADIQHRVQSAEALPDAFTRMLSHPAVARILMAEKAATAGGARQPTGSVGSRAKTANPAAGPNVKATSKKTAGPPPTAQPAAKEKKPKAAKAVTYSRATKKVTSPTKRSAKRQSN